ncbi:unnamed protein product [Eruca vesicaria subsp. sativa]|uniref:Uncharacterized protein n=1 Tax=Eruca vesicaria subsp. sativa TaxID=29727 RepID=A0ABC8LC12_ERUVS|nr:unnamed protein product [Eruca vesicaria subsp. sativa]
MNRQPRWMFRTAFRLSPKEELQSNVSVENDKAAISFKGTELTLGLPGSGSPVKDTDLHLLYSKKLDEKTFFPLVPLKYEISSSSSVKKTLPRGTKEASQSSCYEASQADENVNADLITELHGRISSVRPNSRIF